MVTCRMTSRDPGQGLQIDLDAYISKTDRDSGSVPKDHQYEMTYGESNGHVINNVT